MNAKLPDSIVDARFAKKNIRRVGEYRGKDKPTDMECLAANCGYTGKIRPNDVFRGHGCPRCAGLEKLTEEVIDKRLFAKNIKRLYPITGNNKSRNTFLCLTDGCGHSWTTSLMHVLNKSGCPKCALGKNEKLVGKILLDHTIRFEMQKHINQIISTESSNIRVDFYFPTINTIIEYNGRQHYQPIQFNNLDKERADDNFIKQQKRDQYLQLFCDRHSINLIWIDGRLFDRYSGHTNYKLITYISATILPMLMKIELATAASNLL
jgi:hypothetical protein